MLSRDDIVTLLDELASDLEAQGVHGDLFLVGGAAMALAAAIARPGSARLEPRGRSRPRPRTTPA
jgi:hypothetical protein